MIRKLKKYIGLVAMIMSVLLFSAFTTSVVMEAAAVPKSLRMIKEIAMTGEKTVDEQGIVNYAKEILIPDRELVVRLIYDETGRNIIFVITDGTTTLVQIYSEDADSGWGIVVFWVFPQGEWKLSSQMCASGAAVILDWIGVTYGGKTYLEWTGIL